MPMLAWTQLANIGIKNVGSSPFERNFLLSYSKESAQKKFYLTSLWNRVLWICITLPRFDYVEKKISWNWSSRDTETRLLPGHHTYLMIGNSKVGLPTTKGIFHTRFSYAGGSISLLAVFVSVFWSQSFRYAEDNHTSSKPLINFRHTSWHFVCVLIN